MNRDYVSTIMLVLAAIGIIHSTIKQHMNLPHSLEVVEQEKARVRQSLNSTEQTAKALHMNDATSLLAAREGLRRNYDHVTAELGKAEQDQKLLVSGLHGMIEKGLLHPPDYVLSALRNYTVAQGDLVDQRKSFDKLIRAVTKWRKQASLFEVKTTEIETTISRLRAERHALESKKHSRGQMLAAIRKELEELDPDAPPAAALTDHSHHHPMVATTDKDFRALPLSQWLQQSVYGDGGSKETGGNGKTAKGTCEGDFGTSLIARWRDTALDMCDPVAIDAARLAPGVQAAQLADQSRVTCRPLLQTQHTSSDVLCTMHRVAVNFGALSDPSQTDEVMRKYVSSKHEDQAYLHWRPGLVRGSCRKNANWAQVKVPGWNRDIMEAFEPITAPPPAPPSTTPKPAPPPPPQTTAPPPPAPAAPPRPITSPSPAVHPLDSASLGQGLPPLRPEVPAAPAANASASSGSLRPAAPHPTTARPEIRLQPGGGGAAGGTTAAVGATGATPAPLPAERGAVVAGGRRALGVAGEWWEGLKCDVWEEAPTIVVERDTFANFYHDSEDFFNTFMAMGILELKLEEVRVLLLDFYPQGPFWEVWSRVFNRQIMTAWDVKDKYGTKNVCYRNLILNIIGPAAPFTIHTSVTPCGKAPLLRAYSDFIIKGMQLHHLTGYVRPQPRQFVVVTWMTRKSSVKWPERAFCDDRFFKCGLFEHLNMRSLGRVVKNDEEVAKKLLELDDEVYSPPRRVVVQTKDYNLLPLTEQIANDIVTDVMVGPHGAGLMHSVYMPDRAFLIELGIDGSSGLRHFENLQRWRRSENQYLRIQAKNPVDVKQVYDRVKEMVGKVDLSGY